MSLSKLTKFKKKRHELLTLVDKWTYFIKHAGNLNVIPDEVDDEGLKLAYHEADKYTWKKEELIAYDNASMREQDQKGEIEFAKEEGKREGREDGKEEKEIEAVIDLHENGVPVSVIAKSLKISEERVLQIIRNGE